MYFEKKYKPSGTRANARYRGVTEIMQYHNFIMESVHDLNLLSHITTGNEKTQVIGHERAIEDNTLALFNGTREPAMYDTFTASKLCRTIKDDPITLPALENWEKVQGATVTKTATGYTIASDGKLDPKGIRTPLFVMPGDIIYIRLKIKAPFDILGFAFGSENLNQGEGALKKMDVKKTNDGFFVDYRLYCKHQETIFLNLYVHHQPSELRAQSIEIQSFECMYFRELDVRPVPLNGELKTSLNQTRETINFLKK